MKKKWILLLTGLMTAALIGCGTGDVNQPESSTAVSVESSVPDDAGKETKDESKEETTESSTEEKPEETPQVQEKPSGSLKEVYAQHGMKVGTCLTTQMIDTPKLNQLILEQFNSITMENSMKPDYIFNKAESIANDNLVVEFNRDMIKMLDWAKENQMAVRGHTLVWYSQTPNWIFYENFDEKKGLVSRDVMLARMESYIKQVFTKLEELGYADLFYAYDVANESWMEDGSLRQNNWSKTIGEDYLWYAFYYADKYAPENIDLYYNDYNEQFKADTLVEFVGTLQDEDGRSLIDGIGLQAHLYTRDDLDEYFAAVDKLGATGLKIELTELDVSLGAWQHTLKGTDDNLRVQGRYYYQLIGGLFERADAGTIQMDALTFWGFSDGLSWRKDASPLLYDKKYEPKYAYYGALQMYDYAGFVFEE